MGMLYNLSDGPHFSFGNYLRKVKMNKEQFKPIPKEAIYVFGSNLSGHHGAGTARLAYEEYGAVMGIGYGQVGQSFAIPTKGFDIETLPLDIVEMFVSLFTRHAKIFYGNQFYLTKIGCGLAGFTEDQIRPLFEEDRVSNIIYPYGWE